MGYEHTPNPNPYQIPTEILAGDFRSPEREADADLGLAESLVERSQAGTPDPKLVNRVHLELSRLRATYSHIQSRGDKVPLDTYWEVTDIFRDRIGHIISGEELPES